MRNLTILALLVLNCGLLYGQNSFKNKIFEVSSGDRSMSYNQSIFLDNSHLATRFHISGRGVNGTYVKLFSDTGKYLGGLTPPKDTLSNQSIFNRGFGPWPSKNGLINTHTHSNGSGYNFFYTVKYDSIGTPIWKIDSLLIFESSFDPNLGEFVVGTSNLIHQELLRINNSGKILWKVNISDSLILRREGNKEGVFIHNNLFYYFLSNKKDTTQLLSLDSNGTIMNHRLILGKPIFDIMNLNDSLYFIEKDTSLQIVVRKADLSEVRRYSFTTSNELEYKSLKRIQSGFLVHANNLVDEKIYGVGSVPEIRILDDNLKYKMRRYFRINEFDHYQYTRDNYWIRILAADQITKSNYNIFITAASREAGYRPDAKYYLLRTDSFLNVNDSIQLNGQIRLFEFDSVLTIPTQSLPWYSIDELSESNINIYPNPASNLISVNGITTPNTAFEIYDLNGKLISVGKLNTDNSINVSNLKAGAYILTITSEKGIIRKNIIIEKE